MDFSFLMNGTGNLCVAGNTISLKGFSLYFQKVAGTKKQIKHTSLDRPAINE